MEKIQNSIKPNKTSMMKTNKIKISVIIVNYNGKHLLKVCLDSIEKSLNKNQIETLVVDNNSQDGSVEFIKKNFKKVNIISNKKNLGYSGINTAMPFCKGKYILFLNNDIKLDRGCIEELLDAIENDEEAGMAAPMLVNYYNKKLRSGGTWISRAFYNGHILNGGKPREIPYLGVGLIRKSLVARFGYLFDPDYFIYAEDADLGLRLRLLGYKVVFVPDAIIYHMHAMTTKGFKRGYTTFLLERNLLITFFKILSLRSIILVLPYILLMRAVAMLKDLLSLNFSGLYSRLKAFIWIIFHFDIVYKKRKIVQKMRKRDDKFILKIFSEKYLFKKKVVI